MFKKILCCLWPLLLLSGCAYKSVIFNNLDWLVVYQMDSYLDLTVAQEKQIKIPVHETITWIKAERLPAIHSLMQEIHTAAAAHRVDGRQYDSWMQQMDGWRIEVTDRMTPPVALLLKQLDKDQIEHLRVKLEKGDRELQKLSERSEREYPSALSDYVDDAAGNYKFWFGKLRKDQKEILVHKLGWTRANLNEQLKQRRRSRDFWIDLLKKHEIESLTAAVKNSATLDGPWNDPEYKAFRKDSRDRFRDFLLALFVSLDQDQWQHFEKVTGELVGDIEGLAMQERAKS